MKNGLKPEEGIVMACKMADLGFDGIEVSCGIGEDGGSTLRGDIPFDVILDEWDMYKEKGFFFRFIMRKFGNKLMKPIPFTRAITGKVPRSLKRKLIYQYLL